MAKDWPIGYIPDADDFEWALFRRGLVAVERQSTYWSEDLRRAVKRQRTVIYPRCKYGDHAATPDDDCQIDTRPDRTDEVRERRI